MPACMVVLSTQRLHLLSSLSCTMQGTRSDFPVHPLCFTFQPHVPSPMDRQERRWRAASTFVLHSSDAGFERERRRSRGKHRTRPLSRSSPQHSLPYSHTHPVTLPPLLPSFVLPSPPLQSSPFTFATSATAVFSCPTSGPLTTSLSPDRAASTSWCSLSCSSAAVLHFHCLSLLFSKSSVPTCPIPLRAMKAVRARRSSRRWGKGPNPVPSFARLLRVGR